MELDYNALGERVRILRKKRGLKQEQLAELTGVSLPHISNIENGKTKVGLGTLVMIANVLETGLDMLVCDNLTSIKDPYTNILVEISKTFTNDELRLSTAVIKPIIEHYRKEKETFVKTYRERI